MVDARWNPSLAQPKVKLYSHQSIRKCIGCSAFKRNTALKVLQQLGTFKQAPPHIEKLVFSCAIVHPALVERIYAFPSDL